MFKRLILLSAAVLALAPTISMANGFYLGAGAGRDTAFFDSNLTSMIGPATLFASDDFSGTGYLGTLFGGYGWSYNNFYLGSELDYSVSSLKFHNSAIAANDTFRNDYKIDRNYGISFIPGIKLSKETTLYGRVGYERGAIDTKSVTTGGDVGLSLLNTGNQWLNGVRYGIGVQTALNCNFDMRLEYDHVHYQKFSSSSALPNKLISNSISISPDTDRVELELIYKFA